MARKTKGLPYQTVQFQFAANQLRACTDVPNSRIALESALVNLKERKKMIIHMIEANYLFFHADVITRLDSIED